jgi:hypothetical protein
MTFGNKMEQKKTLTSEQFFSLSLSRTNTLLKAGFPDKSKKHAKTNKKRYNDNKLYLV